MKVFAVGASRNVGYYSSLSLLKAGHTVAFQLRNPSCFDNDTEIQPFVASGHVKLIKGDAMVEEEVRNAWAEANADGVAVDLVLVTIGPPQKFTLTKGWVIDPLNLCSASILNVLSVLPRDPAQQQPRVIAVTSVGVTKESHAKLPFLFKGIYAMLAVPHADKLGMEKAIYWSAGWECTLLPEGWKERLGGSEGWLKSAVIVRPTMLTDGVEKAKYKTGENLSGLYSISRKDVAHFIVNDISQNWEKWDGKAVAIGY
ncbi:hypothetical protein M407DRAFT_231914 [Tulasnella calospora MUT 4182]|uniref:NAD(P)-binding domain-containing protein n=1 Tax=Tulasnella calospora MUT 4182 TaxID=1051891 RepID=A0A0C3M2H8_9AGAM|nr:hypothetical protein M407DRAFT_231914 [Tulasnella calospora MUT 4182]